MNYSYKLLYYPQLLGGLSAQSVTFGKTIVGYLSISACFKTTTSRADMTIFANDPSSTSTSVCTELNIDTKLKYLTLIVGTTTIRSTNFTTNVTNGNWHRVAVAVNGSSVAFYLNGAQVGSTLTSAFLTTTTTFTCRTGVALIGGRASSQKLFTGEIDGVTVYNFALSASRAAALTCGGSRYFCPIEASIINAPVLIGKDRKMMSVTQQLTASASATGSAVFNFAAAGNLWILASCK